ncbi:molybdopterin cofactor-binding domain-containing protein [Qipengyuania sediminis]|uniref:molybdopterin cofactor-binding domain-containing protein n=1 Tax=Qipengyuania sediminis TaxID=1532023 RepID=UPI00197D55DA|nr:molybdopterin cofactor-binding domain-containing protein [Qipengyuania sediminis]
MARREPVITRRGLLVGAAAGGGLLVAWRLWPRHYPGALVPAAGEHGFGAWLTIGEDGVVTVSVPEVEMGQGVTTLLPQIVAHELGADWRQIAVQPVPPNGAQVNVVLAEKWRALPLYESAERWARANAFAVAADGTTLAAYETPAREAGAAARAMLAMAAGELWGIGWEACEVRGGLVMAAGREARFGELAAAAAVMAPPDPPPLRPGPPQERPLGDSEPGATAYPRLDLPAKVDGSMVFAGDVRLPGMLFASIRHGPQGLPFLADAPLPAPPGVRIVRHERWVAAAADSWWRAERALTALKTRFTGPGALDSDSVQSWLAEAVKSEGREIASRGDAAAALEDGNAVFAATYHIAPAVHAPLETASATARLSDGRLELWVASQAPERARRAAARALGIALRDVTLYPMPAGGSFDARLETGHAAEAALLAKALGRPVQLTWSRAEELKTLPPRTPVAIGLAAKLDPVTRLPAAWRARIACPATAREFRARVLDGTAPDDARAEAEGETDPLACDGSMPPYGVPDVALEHIQVTLPFATGRLRGNAPAYTAFATECFVDELARRAGRDPLLYRLGLLGRQPRTAEVLQRAARLGAWDGGRAGSGQGLALVHMAAFDDSAGEGGGRIACVAQARQAEGGLRVDRLTAAVDIGRIVNLDIARQQIEGGLLFGLGLAAGGAVGYANGLPQPSRLAGLGLPLLASTPDIVVELIDSDAPPFDPGEIGVAAAPPAIANALFAATGVRHRSLPLIGGTA